MAKTTIHCTKCGSTVPWAPHCAACGAYLEFAGEPPWQPGPVNDVESTEHDEHHAAADAVEVAVVEETVVTAEVATGAQQQADPNATMPAEKPSSGPIASIAVIGAGVILTPILWWSTNHVIAIAASVVFLVWAAVLAPRGGGNGGSRASQGPIASIVLLVIGAIVTPILWWTTSHVIAIAAAVVFLVWAVILWPRRSDTPAPSEPVIPQTTITEAAIVEVIVEEALIEEPPAPEVLARAPQALPTRVVEATRPMTQRGPDGDVPCLSCLRLNTVDARYCRWCGVPIDVERLAPATTAVTDGAAGTESTPSEKRKGKRARRGLSRSWRAPLLLLTLAGVFLASISLALFGPGAFRVQLGLTRVYQAINEFIDPYSGDQADVESVTASSSLRGTTPGDAQGSDGTTYWASAASTDMGAGSELVVTFTQPYTINRMVILPGIQNTKFDPRAVATPRDITLTFDDGSTTSARLSLLQSEGDAQQLVRFPRVTTQNVTLRIDSVYPPLGEDAGSRVSEVAISGLRFLIPPAPPALINVPTEIQPRNSLPGTTS